MSINPSSIDLYRLLPLFLRVDDPTSDDLAEDGVVAGVLEKIVSAYEGGAETVADQIAQLRQLVDANEVPVSFLRFIIAFLGGVAVSSWGDDQRRFVTRRLIALYKAKGTANALSTFLALTAQSNVVLYELYKSTLYETTNYSFLNDGDDLLAARLGVDFRDTPYYDFGTLELSDDERELFENLKPLHVVVQSSQLEQDAVSDTIPTACELAVESYYDPPTVDPQTHTVTSHQSSGFSTTLPIPADLDYILPSSVIITIVAGATTTISDDGNGKWADGSGGSIDYETGVLVVTFVAPISNITNITVGYSTTQNPRYTNHEVELSVQETTTGMSDRGTRVLPSPVALTAPTEDPDAHDPHCATGLEVIYIDVCQLSCQSLSEYECGSTCETFCQVQCQQQCEYSCEFTCESSCESDAQTPLQPAVSPTIKPNGGTFVGPVTVVLFGPTHPDHPSEGTIRYTTDGSTPTSMSPIYTAPIVISVTTTLKVLTIKPHFANSIIKTAVFVIT